MEEDGRECLQCGSLLKGSSDKRFCSDQCRAAAGNKRKFEDEREQLMRSINVMLQKNRHILRQASPQGKITIRRQVLQVSGFGFRHFTHLYRTQGGNNYHFYYGYLLLPEEKVLIFNWQPYMENE